ncbi:MAG: hypothetical protein ACM31C_28815 [Acidobacteriota bacterium]
MSSRLVIAASLVLAPAIAAADPIKVAVIPGAAVNLDAGRVDALSQDLAEALASELQVDAVGGLDVRRQLPPDGLPADCMTNPKCTADVAQRTGAQQLLFVVLVGTGGAVQIDSTWVEPSTGHQASRPAIDLTSTGDAEAKAKFEAVAHQLLPDAPVRPKPKAGGGVSIDTKMATGKPRHFTTASIATAAGAGAGLLWAIAWGLETRSKYNSCDAAFQTCTPSQRDTIRSYGFVADGGLVVFAGLVAATGVLYFTSGEAPHVVVSPTPEGAGLSYVGRF